MVLLLSFEMKFPVQVQLTPCIALNGMLAQFPFDVQILSIIIKVITFSFGYISSYEFGLGLGMLEIEDQRFRLDKVETKCLDRQRIAFGRLNQDLVDW